MILRLALGLALLCLAQPSAAQSISFPGAIPLLVVNSATAGLQPNAASTSSSYNLTTSNSTNGRITVRLAAPLPSGFVLRVNVAAATGGGNGTSAGWLTLTTTEQDAVTGLPKNKTFSGLGISYELRNVKASDGTMPQTNYGVIFTVY